MQPTPFRLSQALWTAFRAAKPTHRQSLFPHTRTQYASNRELVPRWSSQQLVLPFKGQTRAYSDEAKRTEVERKIEEAKQRIEDSLDSRADIAQDAEPTLKRKEDETIVHTLPEASSIVHTRESRSDAAKDSQSERDNAHPSSSGNASYNNRKYAEWASSQWNNSPLPSQIASLRSRATKRFTTFMDNLQSNIVVAAHHINDLTGYTGIERLKKEIEGQENAVQNSRQHVKDSRDRYSEAIAMRSTTQREVNDLLHRKHAWSPTDLERFTHLYRSDHANEQSEQKAHQQLSEAEAQYEEASTRLAKSILARYHEEQIWSDKIRQMSTWGTWGLMGLNVLLFIVFQIAIEPWRRRRLVRGFEEKVQAALDEKEKVTDEKFAIMRAERAGDQIVQEAVQKQPEGLVATAAEEIAEAIADAVTGATGNNEESGAVSTTEDIERAAEQVTDNELDAETLSSPLSLSTATSEALSDPEPISETSAPSEEDTTNSPSPSHIPIETLEPQVPLQPLSFQDRVTLAYHNAINTTRSAYAHYSQLLIDQFNEKEHVVLSKRDLTVKVLESTAAGIAVGCGVLFMLLRDR